MRVSGTKGPLAGVRIVELASIGPGPHAGMMLADLGADVVRVQRPGDGSAAGPMRAQLRGRTVVQANFKDAAQIAAVKGLIDKADVVIEGFRPGVVERLGLGPDEMLARNPRLIYGRMTGWGQDGPRADRAGHDINYIGLTGALNGIGRKGERPLPPINLLGDYGGGSVFLVLGIITALYERERSGQGQVVDAAMVDGVLTLAHSIWTLHQGGIWSDERGTNLLDTGMAWYDTYATADGKHLAVGAFEPQFYAELLRVLELDPSSLPHQMDPAGQDVLRKTFTEKFATKTQAEWAELFDGVDACVTPIRSWSEAARDEHLRARGSLIEVDGMLQPAPAPRFSRTPPPTPAPAPTELTPIGEVWV
ncbi:CaiB/BaiF CoA-transferase family protein [Nocardia sp. CDC153]|uniref:CaiB/BaiF CoA transferase family protein n=1 Tax=Nocardia sp. CDC153 TaxID=3112167 RepID=UPI002DB6FDD7|nr:CaiB/BaiF CoA-transferase family protein [Nocardia sp. CDC153]MEC3951749.1 CaiB/BaiF CoA-transferase family protein [Nocardia sp. CDC153]